MLIACEFSGVIRDAFLAKGHDAWSCDLLPTDVPGPHIQSDAALVLHWGWDLAICHPPCRFLAVSGARWWAGNEREQGSAIAFVHSLWAAPVPKMALENPIGKLSTVWRKPDQIIQPWQFGHGETKATCLWLRGLPALEPTSYVFGREPRVHHESPGPDRWKRRSKTLHGIACAMADQWGV